ncbi:hypothetical protein TWF718_010854 [Orbilia javanica]|uniref:Uncharacterized protein n=1 Tax=Orbilia javanica TaxID=47235 RepID=A0AAN8R967_9PEZI
MNEQNDILITSILYIILSLASIPLLLLIVWLICKLYKNQAERIKFRSQIKQLEEGLAAATAAPPPTDKEQSCAPVSQNGDTSHNPESTTATNANTQDGNSQDNSTGQGGLTAEQIYYQTSKEMRQWKEARDLFVKRGGQADLAEVLRSQSRTGREEEEEEERNKQQTYVRQHSPPPRIPTL